MNAETLSGNVNRMNRKESEAERERDRDRDGISEMGGGGARVCGTGTVAQSVKRINDEYLCAAQSGSGQHDE